MTENHLENLFSDRRPHGRRHRRGGRAGRCAGRGLGPAGAHVIIADLKDDACQGRVAELQQRGIQAGWCTVNVTQRSSIENLLAATLQQTGRADILVNCAG